MMHGLTQSASIPCAPRANPELYKTLSPTSSGPESDSRIITRSAGAVGHNRGPFLVFSFRCSAEDEAQEARSAHDADRKGENASHDSRRFGCVASFFQITCCTIQIFEEPSVVVGSSVKAEARVGSAICRCRVFGLTVRQKLAQIDISVCCHQCGTRPAHHVASLARRSTAPAAPSSTPDPGQSRAFRRDTWSDTWILDAIVAVEICRPWQQPDRLTACCLEDRFRECGRWFSHCHSANWDHVTLAYEAL